MREDYKLNGPTAVLQVEVEKKVVEDLKLMSKHARLSEAEIVNTALKKFATSHRDFFPPVALKDYI